MTTDAPPLEVTTLDVGALDTCCYIIHPAGGTDAAIIDPGGDASAIAEVVEREGLQVRYLLATHSHFDHVAALGDLHARYSDAEIGAHEICSRRMQSPKDNLGGLIGVSVHAPAATRILCDGDMLDLGGVTLRCVYVPGHAPGHLAFCAEADAMAFVGDVLFQGSTGRYDFPGCSYDDLMQSIHDHLLTLPPETTVYPGHGPATTIGEEIRSNPFLQKRCGGQ